MEATGFWTELRVADRRTLTEQATRRLFRRGETLCRQGDRSASVLMLLSGHVRIMHLTPDGREILVGVRGAGDIVGELAAIDEKPRSMRAPVPAPLTLHPTAPPERSPSPAPPRPISPSPPASPPPVQ